MGLFRLIFVLSLVISHWSFAEVRYVSHSGSSTPPYLTWETAADSIMSAVNISSFGDTIYVANGVYEEVIDMIDGLTIIGVDPDSCIVDTRGFPFFAGFYSIEVLDSCTFAGFDIFTYDNQHGTAILITGGKNSVVKNCRVQKAYEGITINGPFQNKPYITKNIVINTSEGISNYFAQSIIKDNIIYSEYGGFASGTNTSALFINNTIICLSCYEAYDGSHGRVYNNLFFGNGSYGLFAYGDTIINNVIYGYNGDWGDGIFGADLYIENNHIEKSQKGIRYDTGGGSAPVVRYNSLWNNETNFKNFTPDTTNFIANPMFDDAFNQDFHLQMFSPLIDKGNPDILDKDGTRSDIGLYGGPFGEIYQYQDLPPRAPVNLTATLDTNYILLKWNKNTEADFSHYNLYRDTTENFTADSTTFAASIPDTFYLNIIPGGIDNLYFKLAAVDNQGNESESSEELHVFLTGIINNEQFIINNYRLYQNYPNPFNPSTKIGYRLKERGYVKLYVYDIKGELVETLVNQYQDRGYYEVEFGGEVKSQRSKVKSASSAVSGQLASGIYIYQIMVKNENGIPVFSDMKKMILVK